MYAKNILHIQWIIVYRHVQEDCRNGRIRLCSINIIGFLIGALCV